MNKPFSQACENNKKSILAKLILAFAQSKHILEIGTGTGQHAVYFARHLPKLNWQTSDLLINHQGINQWIDEFPANNIQRPIPIDLNLPWPSCPLKTIDGIFTANTLHIVSWSLVIQFFKGIASQLSAGGTICIYGPFNYKGQFTSDSNANFDLWLKEINVNSGIRDFEAIVALARTVKLQLLADHEMPANNRLLVFTKN
jgi:cyclopropane fatty-acyl-phospholipid synthase-like methyltransferase|tara:strand:+ start:462 stop:1061 length:600 start_codon:yes stop_codon:yes gene_type:complete